ncbi:MAG: hypothetical protein RMK94_05970 [Armatimonadota bacterium]|nr:hypothetical protein [Armatimonadota bacterium]
MDLGTDEIHANFQIFATVFSGQTFVCPYKPKPNAQVAVLDENFSNIWSLQAQSALG